MPTVSWDPRPHKSIGTYELVERVGRGSFGEVWKARDSLLNKDVAIKVPRDDGLDERSSRLFLREGQILAQLRHPNIVPVHAILTSDDGRFCIVSDFISGATLAELIKARPFAPREAAEMCRKIALALQHAHERGIVHRDLKPGNILVGNDGEPCVVDFGLARTASADFTIAADGQVLGTAAYMAPEQAAGDNERVSRQSDIYSLGVVLYAMVASHPPFVIGGTRALLYQVLHDDPPPLRKLSPGCPRDLETICFKALQKRPEDRYASARDMADDLGRFLEYEPIKARPVSLAERCFRKIRRHPRLATISAVAALVIAVLSIALVRSLRNAAPPTFRQSISMPVLVRQFGIDGALQPPVEVPAQGQAAGKVRVAFWRRNPTSGEIDFATSLPGFDAQSPVTAKLIPGHYLVVVEIPGHGFHEVERYVPGKEDADKVPGSYKHIQWSVSPAGIELAHVEVPPAGIGQGMALFAGSDDYAIGLPNYVPAPRHRRSIKAFFIAPTEVTVSDYLSSFYGEIPSKLRRSRPPDDFPITGISYDQCVWYAEKAGLRLCDEFEWEFAASNGNQSAFPWGNRPPVSLAAGLRPVKSVLLDKTASPTPVFDLASNAAEMTSSWFAPYPGARFEGTPGAHDPVNERIARGDLASIPTAAQVAWEPLVHARRLVSTRKPEPDVGFRCARSTHPRLRASDFGRVIQPGNQIASP